MTQIARADANPSRAFFVRMLTRDISVEDCILDLVDNSVDRAWQSLGGKQLGLKTGPDFSLTRIDVLFSPNQFTIKDNCGGMLLEVAKKYAFTFGRKHKRPVDDEDFSIGVYGIGLKRAVFKLGEKIAIRSTYAGATGVQAFRVPINVRTWAADEDDIDWDFPIESDEPLPEPGLEIDVAKLTELARSTFEDDEFEGYLRETIARDYALHLHRGLIVTVNGKKVKGQIIELLSGRGFEPLYDSFSEKIGKDSVHIEIIAGLAFPPLNSNDPTEDRSEREKRSGWYVACNGRMVMAADKTDLSVWGDDFPNWHPQYTGFYGLILFSSENRELLPLTTTKRSVDLSSIVYRRARPRMKEPTRAWINYTNARKSEQTSAEAEEKMAEKTSLFAVKERSEVALPKIQRSGPRETSIQFRMPLARVKNLARAFGDITLSNRDVGRKAFDYSYDDLVDE